MGEQGRIVVGHRVVDAHVTGPVDVSSGMNRLTLEVGADLRVAGRGGDPALRPRRLLPALRAHADPPRIGTEPDDPAAVVDAPHRFDDDAAEIEQQ